MVQEVVRWVVATPILPEPVVERAPEATVEAATAAEDSALAAEDSKEAGSVEAAATAARLVEATAVAARARRRGLATRLWRDQPTATTRCETPGISLSRLVGPRLRTSERAGR